MDKLTAARYPLSLLIGSIPLERPIRPSNIEKRGRCGRGHMARVFGKSLFVSRGRGREDGELEYQGALQMAARLVLSLEKTKTVSGKVSRGGSHDTNGGRS